jgi:hypothetical protein
MRRGLLAAGVLVMLYAVVGAVADLGGKLGGVLIFLIAVLVVHDGIWMPLVLLAGTLLDRVVPERYRGPVRIGAIVAVAVTLAALPLAFGLGRTADNPSALPLDYGRNLALVLLAVAVATAVTVLGKGRKNPLRRDANAEEADTTRGDGHERSIRDPGATGRQAG